MDVTDMDQLSVRNSHDKIAQEALAECHRQLDRWGIQNHPLGTGPNQVFGAYGGQADEMCRILRDLTDSNAQAGTVTWMDILFEEVFEAYEASDPDDIRKEMLQVVAVGISMIASLDRNDL